MTATSLTTVAAHPRGNQVRQAQREADHGHLQRRIRIGWRRRISRPSCATSRIPRTDSYASLRRIGRTAGQDWMGYWIGRNMHVSYEKRFSGRARQGVCRWIVMILVFLVTVGLLGSMRSVGGLVEVMTDSFQRLAFCLWVEEVDDWNA
jgi:hypothetical protein